MILQLFVVSLLLFSPFESFKLFCLHGVYLKPWDLCLVIEFFRFVPWLFSIFLLDLVLQKTAKHVFLLVHPYDPFLLLLVYSLLESLNLLLFELVSLYFSFPVHYCSLIFVDIMQFLLIFDKLGVVLFIHWVLLGLNLASDHHLFIILVLLSLFLLPLSCLYLLFHG